MFRITVDTFSGRPNPTWIVNDERKGKELLDLISKEKQIISKPGAGFEGLGYRGIQIELFGDEDAQDYNLPESFYITDGSSKDHKTGVDVASRIFEQMLDFKKVPYEEPYTTPINRELQKMLLERLRKYESDPPKLFEWKRTFRSSIRVTVNDRECDKCQYEESRFNPGFWNANDYVKKNNNCYNYARNWRTNTFAQPGRYSGITLAGPGDMNCNAVTAAAMADGLKKRCDCLPASEYPRRLVALVIDPSWDYHWYRKQKNGFWGHKPGRTEAKNVDNSGAVITDPRTCDRGGYTDFCGFFYAGKSVNII